MKNKMLFSLILILFVATGCGKKLICNSKNDIMDLDITVEYKNKEIKKMILNYNYDLSKYGDNDIEQFKKQDFCSLIETSSDTFAGAIKKCSQSVKSKNLIVNAEIDITKLSSNDITKKSKIEDVKKSFENAGSTCKIK